MVCQESPEGVCRHRGIYLRGRPRVSKTAYGATRLQSCLVQTLAGLLDGHIDHLRLRHAHYLVWRTATLGIDCDANGDRGAADS